MQNQQIAAQRDFLQKFALKNNIRNAIEWARVSGREVTSDA